MNKDLVNALNDSDFSVIVLTSHSITEVARKLGFAHKPGSSSAQRIKERINKLDLKLSERKKYKNTIKEKNESFFESNIKIGNIGESKFLFESAVLSLRVSKPVFEGLPYDYLVEKKDGSFLKIQVKTTEYINGEFIDFYTRKKIGHLIVDIYSEKDVDYFYLYCIQTDQSFLIKNKKQGSIRIRLEETKNNQIQNVNFYNDFIFKKEIINII